MITDTLETDSGGGKENVAGDGTDIPPEEKSVKDVVEDHLKEDGDSIGSSPAAKVAKEETSFKVIYSKKKYDLSFDLNATVSDLKKHLQDLTGVPPAMQKIMFKGLADDGKTLKELGVTKGCKIMLVGSKLDDVLSVAAPDPNEIEAAAKEEVASATKEPFCKMQQHKKVLDKYGKPEDAMVGVKGVKERLPVTPLSGMMNKIGGRVRLTFKLELDQLWIGTKDRTEKLPMSSIKAIVSDPIESHPEYHIMGLQLGPTELSRYWIYWVPAQYVDAIKDAILGKFF